MPGADEEGRVFRPGGVSYLHILSPDPASSAARARIYVVDGVEQALTEQPA